MKTRMPLALSRKPRNPLVAAALRQQARRELRREIAQLPSTASP